MAIYGIGAYYDRDDMTKEFLSKEAACIGWNKTDAPPLHKMMKHIKTGDILYIKSHPPTEGLIIKAIGVVIDDEIFCTEDIDEACLKVKWIWKGEKNLGKIDDKNNVRNNTLYEELNPDIQKFVIDLLLPKFYDS